MQYKNANISLLPIDGGFQGEIAFPGGRRVTTMIFKNEHDQNIAQQEAIKEAKTIDK